MSRMVVTRNGRARRPGPRGAGLEALAKCPTGIQGLDDITRGGLPRGRPTLVCGGAGCGKTLFAVEFLVRGATEFGEPGVFMSFEESESELAANVASLGLDLAQLSSAGRLVFDFVGVERSEIEETGEYDLEGLFVRLGHAIDQIGAKRVVLDTIESLFSGLNNHAVLRAELRRLFHWLKDRGVTAVITGERGREQLTRQGLEEYVSDCVILLDHRVEGRTSTRRLRIVKYRGSAHGTDEYPFLIAEEGISVVPITTLRLDHKVSEERVSSGIPALDDMLGGGLFRGSSVLISGTAGTGKSSVTAHFADAVCRRGETCLVFAFEEAHSQIVRNMKSIGIDLDRWVKAGRLHFLAERPTSHGLENHLASMHRAVRLYKPRAVVFDPLTNLLKAGTPEHATSMLTRLIDFLKAGQITAMFTSLTQGGEAFESTEIGVSSLMDTWIVLRDLEVAAERNRVLHLVKSRGMAHSNQVREFLITSGGVRLRDVYLGPGGLLTGSSRLAQEAADASLETVRRLTAADRERQLERKRLALEARIAALRAKLEADEAEVARLRAQEEARERALEAARMAMATSRRAGALVAADPPAKPDSRPRKNGIRKGGVR